MKICLSLSRVEYFCLSWFEQKTPTIVFALCQIEMANFIVELKLHDI